MSLHVRYNEIAEAALNGANHRKCTYTTFPSPKKPRQPHTSHIRHKASALFLFQEICFNIKTFIFYAVYASNNSCVLSASVKTKVKIGGKERRQNTRGDRTRVGYILQIRIIFCLYIRQMRVKCPSANLKFTA